MPVPWAEGLYGALCTMLNSCEMIMPGHRGYEKKKSGELMPGLFRIDN
jgi:hypothetical protein